MRGATATAYRTSVGVAVKRRFRTIAVALVLFGASDAPALDPARALTQYSHRAWQSEEGLPQNSVRAIAQTPEGYIWAGTQAGLVRFDGVRFDLFDRRNTEALAGDSISSLMVDPSGDLWIGIRGGGLVRRHDGVFEEVVLPEGLKQPRVSSLEAGDDTVWIGTLDIGVLRWSRAGVEVIDQRRGLPPGEIRGLAVDSKGGCWIGIQGGGVHYFGGGRIRSYRIADGIASDMVWGLHLTGDGVLWVATSGGVSRYAAGGWTTFTTSDGLTRNWARTILTDSDDNLWVGTMGGGLNRWSDGVFTSLTGARSESRQIVWTLFEDREGSLWFGTLSDGLHQLCERPFTTFGFEEGFASQQAHAVLEDHDGALWVATNGGGIHRFYNGRFERWTTVDGLSNDTAWSLLQDRDGALWVGTSGTGVDCFKDGTWTNISTEDGLAHPNVISIMQDSTGDLWFATKGALTRYRDGEITNFTTAEGLVHNDVARIIESDTGDLWVGTVGGLSAFDGVRFTNYTSRDGLSANDIWSLYEDAAGTLWIGTFGGGLNRFTDGRFTTMTTRDGMLSNDITAIVEDDAENLWLASTSGVFRVAKLDLEAFAAGRLAQIPQVSFGREDGLRSAECYGGNPIGIKARDGRLWFSTLAGIAMIDPRLPAEFAPAPLLGDMFVDGRLVRQDSDLTIPPGSRRLEFRYSAATLLAPMRVRFRHRLKGFEEEWHEVGTRREATYTNMSPGRYSFEVMASNEGGQFRDLSTSVSFVLAPRFTQTAAFFGLCGLGLVALGYALQQVRVQRLRRREAELAAVAEAAVANAKVLSGLLPLCAWCRKIRSDEGYWERLESYVDKNTDASFTHGMCPACAKLVMAEVENSSRREHTTDSPHK